MIQTEVLDSEHDSREGARHYEFDDEAVAAVRELREDFGRRLELASNRQDAMMQSIGVILAFASILLVEAVRSLHLGEGAGTGTVSLLSFLICSIIGVATIWQWRNWELYAGLEYGRVSDSFSDRRFVELRRLLLESVVRSHGVATRNNYIIRGRIKYMVMCFLIGIASMLAGLVI